MASELLLRPAWALLEHGLAQAVQQALHGYWHHWRHQSENCADMFSPEVQVTRLSQHRHMPFMCVVHFAFCFCLWTTLCGMFGCLTAAVWRVCLTMLGCAAVHCGVLPCAGGVPCHAVLCRAVLCCAALLCALLCCAALCRALLCSAVLSCAVACSTVH